MSKASIGEYIRISGRIGGEYFYSYMSISELVDKLRRVANMPELVPVEDIIVYLNDNEFKMRVKGVRTVHGINASPTIKWRGFKTRLRGEVEFLEAPDFLEYMYKSTGRLAGAVRFAKEITVDEALKYLKRKISEAKKKSSRKKIVFDEERIRREVMELSRTGIRFEYKGSHVWYDPFEMYAYKYVRFHVFQGGKDDIIFQLHEPEKYGISAKLFTYIGRVLVDARPLKHDYEDEGRYYSRLRNTILSLYRALKPYAESLKRIEEYASKITSLASSLINTYLRKLLPDVRGKVRYAGLSVEVPVALIRFPSLEIILGLDFVLKLGTLLEDKTISWRDVEEIMGYVMLHEMVHAIRNYRMKTSIIREIEEEETVKATDKLYMKLYNTGEDKLKELKRKIEKIVQGLI